MSYSSIFVTLIMKNFQKQKYNTLIFVLSVCLPVLASVLLLLSPESTENTSFSSLKMGDDGSFDLTWNSLIEKINGRRDLMLTGLRNFEANVFIPQIRVAYANSSHAGIHKLMEAALEKLGITKNQIHGFSSCDDMRTRATFKQFIACVCFHNDDVDMSKNGLPKLLHFSIIMPSEVRNYEHTWIGHRWKQDSPIDGHQFSMNTADAEGDGGFTEYLREGFVPLQYHISTEYLRMAAAAGAGSANFEDAQMPAASLRSMEGKGKSFKQYSDQAVIAALLMTILGFMFPVTLLVKLMVDEWETGQRGVLEVNNVSITLQMASWFINGCAQLVLTSGLLTTMLLIDSNTMFANGHVIFPFFVFYNFSVCSLIILIAVIIPTTRAALVIVPIIWFFIPFPFLFVEEIKLGTSSMLYLVATILLCNVTMSKGFKKLLHTRTTSLLSESLMSREGGNFDFGIITLMGIFIMQTLLYVLLVLIIQTRILQRLVHCLISLTHINISLRRNKDVNNRLIQAKMAFHKETRVVIEDIKPILIKNLGIDSRDDLFEEEPYKRQTIHASIKSDGAVVPIEFRRVSKHFKKTLVIDEFSLSVLAGEVVVLLGHNASGKTTIMRMICGLTVPSHGNIYVFGINVLKHHLYVNMTAFKGVGMSLSNEALFSEFTVFNHLVFFCRLRGLKIDDARIEVSAYLRYLQMENIQEILVGDLSIGQKRILQSLTAFVGRTQIVLLHKPLDGVDEQTAQLFFSFVKREKRNRSIFVTTNRSKVASGLADRIAILAKGRLVFYGTERELCQDFSESYRLTFYGSAHCDFNKVERFLKRYIQHDIEVESKISDLAVFLISKKDLRGMECSLDKVLIKFTPEPVNFALQEKDEKPIRVNTKNPAWESFRGLLAHAFIVIRQRTLLDYRHRGFLLLKILWPTVVVIWMGICLYSLQGGDVAPQKRDFPIADGRGHSVVTFAKHGSIIANDGPLKAAYNEYVTMGAKEVEPDLDMSDMRNIPNDGSQDDMKVLATAKFKSDEVEALFNNKWVETAPHSLALVMNSLAVGFVGSDSGIKVHLELLPDSTVHTFVTYNMYLISIFALCLSFCFVWCQPMLFKTLDRDLRFNYVELIAGMRLGVLVVSMIVYDLIVFMFSFWILHLVVIALRLDSLMNPKIFLFYAHSIMLVALCVLSINMIISLGSVPTYNGYQWALAFHILGIIVHVLVRELPPMPDYIKFAFLFLDFYPLYSLMDNMITVANITERDWLCKDNQIYHTSVHLERCNIYPNCCDEAAEGYHHYRYVICTYTMIIFMWVLIGVQIRASTPQYRKRQEKQFPDSDPDSHAEQHMLQFVRPTEVQKTWIFEKSRVRTLERSMIWMRSVHVENLSVLFGPYVALENINFMVDRHQVMSVFGANGSGKSVMMKAILGIYESSLGRVGFSNRVRYQRYKPANGNLAGYSAQEVVMMKKLTVLEVIKIVLEIRNRIHRKFVVKEAKIICKILNLYFYRYHFLSACSQGVLKRLSIGLAMMTNTELILLDDPFANLDVITQHSVLQSIQDAVRHGLCVMYTCSDTDFSAPAQRLAALGSHGFDAFGERQELTRAYYTSYYVIETKVHLPELEAIVAQANEKQNLKEQGQRNKSKKSMVSISEEQEPDLPGAFDDSSEQQLYLGTSDFVENIFPQAIVKSVSYPRTSFWLSTELYSMSDIFRALIINEDNFYSFTISQPSVGAIYLHITPERNQ